MQRTLCAAILGLQAIVLFLTTPVMLVLTDVRASVGLSVGIGLSVACILVAGLMRRPVGGPLGWAIQAASVLLGFVVPVMFALGVVFLGLYAAAYTVGARIDRERAEREQHVLPPAAPGAQA